MYCYYGSRSLKTIVRMVFWELHDGNVYGPSGYTMVI